jgi:hypothetical protein
MFGYIAANKPELKIREYERYHAYYCGLCKSLKHRRGFLGQLTLSYDMTFLGILLTSLYEPHTVSRKERCVVHPGARHVTAINDCVRYAADMNLLLAYYDLLDNWKDDRDVRCMVHAKTLAGAVTKIRSEYPRQAAAVDDYVRKLSDCESSNDMDIDHAAGLTGAMLGRQFADFVAFSAPEAIVVFGGLARAGDFIFKPLKEALEANLLPIWKGKVAVIPSALKESDAAILGASALAW